MGKGEMPAQTRWDEEFDVVVVGSGAGGLTAALCCRALGLSVVVIEKDKLYGGTSAVSGGGIWIPCSDEAMARGARDSFDEALTYLKNLIGDMVPEERLRAYLQAAPEMVRFLEKNCGVHYDAVEKYPDYYPDRPGGKAGFRTMEPASFDARKLGDDFEQLREPYKGTLVMGRMSMTQVEAHTLMCRNPGWIALTMRMMLGYWSDLGWRRRTWRDRRLVLGQGMIGALRYALKQRQAPLLLNTGLESLVSDDAGRVAGVVARSKERTLRFGARRGVVLACGGFESNQGMREQYLPKPTDARWTAAPNINHGDGIRAGQALGASVGLMDLTWGAPTIMVPGAGAANAIFIERQLPGCIMVNGNGRRFVNEAAPYLDIVYAMYGDHATSKAAVPCWFVFDGQFRRKYPIGPIMPSTMQPDSKLPKDWIDRVLYRADTLDQLAAKIGVDAAGLAASVERMNEYARTGIDAEFGKGNNAFDRYYGDSTVKPNPCLGALAKPPFYAFRFEAGEIGTKGGLLTDTAARVLREDGAVIEGLYAVGNCSSAVMGPTYPGAGGTLGPAMTFAYLAARHLAGQTAAGGAVGDAAAAKAGAVS